MSESLKDLFGTPDLMFTKEQMAIPEPKVFIGGQELVVEAPKPDREEQRQAILKNRSMKAIDKIKALRALGKR